MLVPQTKRIIGARRRCVPYISTSSATWRSLSQDPIATTKKAEDRVAIHRAQLAMQQMTP